MVWYGIMNVQVAVRPAMTNLVHTMYGTFGMLKEGYGEYSSFVIFQALFISNLQVTRQGTLSVTPENGMSFVFFPHSHSARDQAARGRISCSYSKNCSVQEDIPTFFLRAPRFVHSPCEELENNRYQSSYPFELDSSHAFASHSTVYCTSDLCTFDNLDHRDRPLQPHPPSS